MASLMEALANMYEKLSAMNMIHLMHHKFNMRMVEGASMTEQLNEFNAITTYLTSVSINFDDEVRSLLFLSFLPESWNSTIIAVSDFAGKKTLKFKDTRDLI